MSCLAAFAQWCQTRGVWPRLTHEEIWKTAWNGALQAADNLAWAKRDLWEEKPQDQEKAQAAVEIGEEIRSLICPQAPPAIRKSPSQIGEERFQHALEMRKFDPPKSPLFAYVVEVEHGDGSKFSIKYASTRVTKDPHDEKVEYLVICAEHIMPITLHLADLASYAEVDPASNKKVLYWKNPEHQA